MDIEVKVKGYVHIPKEDMLVLRDEHFQDADFSGRKLVQFCAITCRFERCNFSKMTTGQAVFGGGTKDSVYIDCVFDGAKLTAPAPGYARFVRCSFRNVAIRELRSYGLEFVDCTFSGKLGEGIFDGTLHGGNSGDLDRKTNEFHGNDFSKLAMQSISFRTGIDLHRQILPQGEQYILVHDALAKLEKLKGNFPPELLVHKKAVDILLNVIERHLRRGQDGFFLNMNSFRKESQEPLRLLKIMLADGLH